MSLLSLLGKKKGEKKNGATAVLVIFFVFLLELKDFVRLRGLRILSDQWA